MEGWYRVGVFGIERDVLRALSEGWRSSVGGRFRVDVDILTLMSSSALE